ncbi:MAG: M1 family metallopeptidase [Planctomycetota bacterium]
MKILLTSALTLFGVIAEPRSGPLVRVQDPRPAASLSEHDPRSDYDVQAYRIDLTVDPELESIDGHVFVDATALVEDLRKLRLDLAAGLALHEVRFVTRKLEDESSVGRTPLEFSRSGDLVDIDLPTALPRGARVCVELHYSGKPTSADDFSGFHWRKTPDGKPWIATSCQDTGSHAWWPCKDSYWHPEDKPERVLMNIRVPSGLTAVCNGRLVQANRKSDGGQSEFHWVHDYPLETYSVALNIAPYVAVHQELALEGLQESGGLLGFDYFVIPGHEERAKLQFQDVPKMLAAYSKAFGPFPFPKSKYALVETPYWGMEHSTCVAYGSSFPAWCKANGEKDRYASRNKFYDYILIHESAHEWWGNAVSAADWGDFWIHEGFATYAEGVYLEFTENPERAEEFFSTQRKSVSAKSRLYSGKGANSGEAYNAQIYSKGAAVLHTLRQFVADDEAWWRTLRGFNLAFRYKNATTEDFRARLEAETHREWKTFFDEWIYGSGYPKLEGSVAVDGRTIVVEAKCGGSAANGFHLPLDLSWTENGAPATKRVWLEPGPNSLRVECKSAPQAVKTVGLDRLLGRFELEVLR